MLTRYFTRRSVIGPGNRAVGHESECYWHPDRKVIGPPCVDCPPDRRYCSGCVVQSTWGYTCKEHTARRARLRNRRLSALGGAIVLAGIAAVRYDVVGPGNPPPPPITVFQRESNGNVDIYVRHNETGLEKRLTDDPAEDSHPQMTYRGGGRVVFQSNRSGHYEIYVMELDGSGQRRLTSGASDNTEPDWSPDERRIVFISTSDVASDVYVMNADGSRRRRLTDSPGLDATPAWASNVRLHGGTEIAFSSLRNGNWDIYAVRPDGSGLRSLTQDPGWDTVPAWSPDGRRIAFLRHTDGNREIYVMHADGSNQTRLTYSSVSEGAPLWSEDGRRINFNVRGGDGGRFTVNADGTGLVRTHSAR